MDRDEVLIVKPNGAVRGNFSSFGILRGFRTLNQTEKEKVIKGLIDEIKEYPVLIKLMGVRNKPELWIENRLTNDPSLTPKRVAYECMFYMEIDKKMMPYLIKLARRIKDRLRKREVRNFREHEVSYSPKGNSSSLMGEHPADLVGMPEVVFGGGLNGTLGGQL